MQEMLKRCMSIIREVSSFQGCPSRRVQLTVLCVYYSYSSTQQPDDARPAGGQAGGQTGGQTGGAGAPRTQPTAATGVPAS